MSAERALAVSLTENFAQQAMSPADEFTAFKNLIDQGHSVSEVATAYGLTDLYVLRRLKMARLAPSLFELFRSGEMKLDQLQALCATDDVERQVQVWESLGTYGRGVWAIKRALEEEEVSHTDKRVALIGLDAYKAAGGTLREDLFATEEALYLTDVGLVELMVAEKLEAAAEAARKEGWSFVELLQDFDYSQRARFNEPKAKYFPETDAQTAQRKALEAQSDALQTKQGNLDWDDEGSGADEENDRIDAELETISNALEALEESRLDTTGYDKTTTGVVVTLGADGIEIKRGLMLCKVGGKSQNNLEAKPKVKADIPEKLMLNLTSQKTAAIQASLIAQPNVALAALAANLAGSIFSKYGNFDNPVKIKVTECRHDLERNSPTVGASRAAKEIDATTQAWIARLPAKKAEYLAWFLVQDASVSTDFIVYATALSANTMASMEKNLSEGAVLAEAVSLDMTQWWSADVADNFISLVPKGKIIAAVTEACGAEAALPLEKLKRKEAVELGAKLLEGTGWLPAPLRPIAPVVAATVDADDEDGDNEEFADKEEGELAE